MPHQNPALDRTGIPQNYTARIAANLNFLKRNMRGHIAINFVHRNHLWIKAHEEYLTALTSERRAQLDKIHDLVDASQKAAQKVIDAVEEYYTLPKMPQPKRERQKALRRAKIPSMSDAG